MRPKVTILALFLLLPFLSCHQIRPPGVASMDFHWMSPSPTILWAFECGFAPKHKGAAREGFDYWNQLAGRTVFVEYKACLDSLSSQVPVSLVVKVGETEEINKTTRFGTAGRVGNLKEINYYGLWMDSDWRTQIGAARHEAGHVLGLEHSDKESCLMFPTISPFLGMAKQACDAEVQLVRKYYGTR